MISYELEVKRLDKVISDLEEKLTAGTDPIFKDMLKRFKDLRKKYQYMIDTNPRLRKERM
jgi:hypothetical protein